MNKRVQLNVLLVARAQVARTRGDGNMKTRMACIIRNGVNTTTLCVALLLTGGLAHAIDRTWDGDTDTDFANGNNWTGGTVPANNTTGDKAVFGSSLTTYAPSLTANRSINGLIFQKTDGGWTLGGSGRLLTLGAGGIDDTANTGGTTTINADVTLGYIGGAAGPWLSGAGGTIDVRGTTIVTGGNRNITVNSGTVTLATLNADTTARTVTKAGAGTLAITGAAGANLQGSFSLGGGILILSNNSAMGTGTFLYNAGTLQASQDLVIANAFDYANSGTGGSIGGSNNITFSNTFRVAPGNTGNAGRTLDNSLASGKTLTFSGNVYIADLATVARTLTLSGSGNTTFSGNIANYATSGANGALTVTSTGVTTLSGSNSYSGVTTVNAGTLVAAHANACGTVGTITANSGGTFAVASGITFTRAVFFNSGSAIGGSGTFSRGAAWSLPASFTVRPGLADAPGTLTVDTVAGNLTFGNNTLEIDVGSSVADRLTVSGGGTLDLSGTTDTLVLRGTAKPGTYVLADAAGVSGTFATENTTGLSGKGTVVYEANRVLFVVPATGTVVSIQ